MDIIMNQIAIWKPCGATELNIREEPRGRRYRTPDSPIYKQAEDTFKRYAKDYTSGSGKNKVGFCLFLRTECNDAEKVERAMDKCASQLTKEAVCAAIANADMQNFKYTDYVFDPNETVILTGEK